jgi:hypothetical protein
VSNKRRSERYRIELPVWLKDAHGGDRTVTADVSAHGIAVLSDKPRTLRQYVELELTLPSPSPKIGVTAMVARVIDGLELEDGRHGRGLGLDFFLFDSKAKVEWQKFIQRARTELSEQNTDAAARASPPDFDDREDTADEPEGVSTFIIKPRDLGRLWAFFRGELSKGTVRIETPIARELGEPVELLVVHPGSQSEWTLPGRVARMIEHGRGGRPVLEIELVGLDAETRARFRNFVATGQGMIEEDIPLSSEIPVDAGAIVPEPEPEPPPAPSRMNSVVIDLGTGGEEELVRPRAETDLSLLADEEPLFEEWLEPTEGREDEPLRLPSSALSPANPLEPFAPEQARDRIAEPDHPRADDDDAPSEEPTEYRDLDASSEVVPVMPEAPPPPPSAESLSGRLFASFFFEAEASKRPSRSMVASLPSQEKSTTVVSRPISAKLEVKAGPPPLPKTPPPLPNAPERDEQPAIAAAEQAVPVVRGSPSMELAVLRATPAPREKEANPITVEPWFEKVGNRVEDQISAPPATPLPAPSKKAPNGRRAAARANFEEAARNAAHRQVSTAGIDPNLDRDIALARARVVRSPNSVTACFRLSTLLMRRGEQDGFLEAIDALERVMDLEPNHPGAHHAAAEALARRGDYDAAADHLARARRLGYRIDPELERSIAEGRGR